MALKIIFMGTPEFAVPTLKAIHKSGHKILEVYTQPAKKSHRGQKINKSPVQSMSEVLSIKVRTPLYLKNNKEEYEYIKKINL